MDTFIPELAPRVPLSESIAASLRRAIILGELPTGLHLDEPSLSQKFRASRIPIREAIGRLRDEGLIRVEPHRGAYVVAVTERDLNDFAECRHLIEMRAVRLAAERATNDGVAKLQRLVDKMNAALQRGHAHLIAGPDLEFHNQIVVLADNRFLLALWKPIAGLVGSLLNITDWAERNLPVTVRAHQELVVAIAAHDAAAAEERMAEHLRLGQKVMMDLVSNSARAGNA